MEPGVDVAYKLGKVTTAYASADQSVRYPTTDLYYARGNAFGSIDLRHESALNLEAGLRRGVDKNIRYNVALFHRRSANLTIGRLIRVMTRHMRRTLPL